MPMMDAMPVWGEMAPTVIVLPSKPGAVPGAPPFPPLELPEVPRPPPLPHAAATTARTTRTIIKPRPRVCTFIDVTSTVTPRRQPRAVRATEIGSPFVQEGNGHDAT